MEKFGIFELLDALSALNPAKDAQNSTLPPENDNAFQPPVYGEGTVPAVPSAQAADKATPKQDALSNFYARHEAVAKKAKK